MLALLGSRGASAAVAALRGVARTNAVARTLSAGSTQLSSEASSGLLLSDACVQRLQKLSSDEGKTVALRISVEGGGCSGFQYKFDLETDPSPAEDDLRFERDGAAILIDETSLEYLKGSTVDYHEELIRSAFRISDNPVAGDGCSCGASFNLKL